MSHTYNDGVQNGFAGYAVSYIEIEEAQCYFDTRMNTDSWDCASDTDKQKSLYAATRAIDRLNFSGVKYDPQQRLEFPRKYLIAYNSAVDHPTVEILSPDCVPQEIKIAVCECALSLLDGVDPEQEIGNLTTISQGYGVVRETYDRTAIVEHYRAGIPSSIAWTYLKPFLHDPRQIDFRRV